MKISIIIPVYNTDKYLEECLNSVLNQDYSDFEVLVIDDGSPMGRMDFDWKFGHDFWEG